MADQAAMVELLLAHATVVDKDITDNVSCPPCLDDATTAVQGSDRFCGRWGLERVQASLGASALTGEACYQQVPSPRRRVHS